MRAIRLTAALAIGPALSGTAIAETAIRIGILLAPDDPVGQAIASFPMLAVSLFLLSGNRMNQAGITDRLARFSRLLSGWMAGGLVQLSICWSS